MAKELRPGKVFIDWSQNSDFKTTVSVYSLRAKADQPFVSAPVTWEELESAGGSTTRPACTSHPMPPSRASKNSAISSSQCCG